MTNVHRTSVIVLFLIAILANGFFSLPKAYAATSPNLGQADRFAVLGAAHVTNVPTSSITGDVGLSPASGSLYSGITQAQVTGTIYAVDGAGPAGSISNASLLTTAKNNLSTAYDNLNAGDNADGNCVGGIVADATDLSTYDFGNPVIGSFPPGVYCSAGSFQLTTTITLTGSGVWVFKTVSGLDVSNGASVTGGDPCNVWWRVGSSAVLGTTAAFRGNILAYSSVTMRTGATLSGRAMASNADVILDSNTITNAACAAAATPTPTPSSGSSSSSSSNSTSSTGDTVHPPLSSTVIAPYIIDSRRVDANSVFISWGPYSGIDTFNVQYGLENGVWLYSTNVTGFFTTINDLPLNRPIWVRIAARNEWTIGRYGEAKLVGGPSLPNTGLAPYKNTIPWYVPAVPTWDEKLLFQNSFPLPESVNKTSSGLPVRLSIPAINVHANIQHLGITPQGEMEVPDNAVDVGWFESGSRPGEKGSAVIAGHLDGKNGESGVFTHLHKLKEGDKLYIEDDKGTSTTFIVRESRMYDPGYADDVFTKNDNAHLNLVTCDGFWDANSKSYSKRLVVFTDITQ